MKLFKKLNQAGAAHFVVPAFVILVIGAIGTVVFIASHADTVTYSCDRGGTLSVTTCSYPATSTPGPSTTYASLCNSGDSSSNYNWNGTGGYHCAHLVSSVGLYGSCPSGQYKAYTYCYTIYRPYCSSGDTVSSDYSTCTHVASTTYSCAYPGDTLSGSTCSYPATATTTSTGGTSGTPSISPVYPYQDSTDASADLGRINNYRGNHGWSTLSEAPCLDTIASNWAKTRAAANSLQDPGSSWFMNQFNTICNTSQYPKTLQAWGVNTGQTGIGGDAVLFDGFIKSCEHIQNIADRGAPGTKINVGPCTDAYQKYHNIYNVSSSGYNRVGTGAWVAAPDSQSSTWVFVCQIYARW